MPLARVAEGGFKTSLASEETMKCSPMIVAYCCYNPAAKDVSAALHGAKRPYTSDRSRNTYDDLVTGRRRSSGVVTETVETRGRAKICKRRL